MNLCPTPAQARFCQEVVSGLCGAAAYAIAYNREWQTAPRSRRKQYAKRASELKRKPHIRALIDTLSGEPSSADVPAIPANAGQLLAVLASATEETVREFDESALRLVVAHSDRVQKLATMALEQRGVGCARRTEGELQ